MNISLRARARGSNPSFWLALGALALMGQSSTPNAWAQQATGTVGGYRFQANRITNPGGSVRAEGSVRLSTPNPRTSPQIDIAAPLVTADANLRRLRAQGGVSLEYSAERLSRTDANSVVTRVPISVKATAQEALLDTVTRDGRNTLTLSGSVDGFYKIGDEQTVLKGQRAVISTGKSSDDVQVTIEGGSEGFDLLLPEQSFGTEISLGAVSLQAERFFFDAKDNTARFAGGARLASRGPGVLKVSAPAFVAGFAQVKDEKNPERTVRRLKSLTSEGRVSISLDLPPQNIGTAQPGTQDSTYPLSADSAVLRMVPRPASPASAQPTPTPGEVPSGQTPTGESTPKTVLVPVSVRIAADSAVIEPISRTLTLRGNVSGSYVLRKVLVASRPKKAPAQADPAPNGDSKKDEGPQMMLDLDIEGAPVSIEFPSLNLAL